MPTPQDEAPAQRDLVLGLLLGHRGHRGDAHGAAGRADGRDHGDADADDEADDDGAGLEDQRARRQRDAEPAEQRFEPEGGQHPEAEADQRRHQPHDRRLAEDGAEHLAAAGPDDAQQGQLARALPHNDGERVEDGEPAHEERDEGEDEQRRVEEAQRLADGARRLVDHGLTGHHLDAAGQRPRDVALHGRLVRARLGDDVDGVELAHVAEERAARSAVSKAASVAPARLLAVPKRASPVMVKVSGGPFEQDPHVLAHLEVVLLRRPEVHDHVVRRRRRRALGQAERRRSAGRGRRRTRGSARRRS